ncbi:MFS transporter [Paenibacillus harenae]|uniref:DHA3 family macrolide efflux protein-like MFS transporter n=1 Tax=Paenibacillus harenae TaxID=306543 RepID=A0ABT9UEX2_PAEHA|nr:MFS transporter [Paenibacillus harenae]MDQ0064106.1 DHA3 family macrolide efflux protein-like MFS transporter [Paenibacillus harenae]MDQ0116769.1 DHA3 family macrolide efflux protein-like MFS transporter [Paenibacillus harenae]
MTTELQPTTNATNWKKAFATIFTGQIFSILTTAMVQFSIIWHLTETTESAVVLTIAGLIGFLPQALLGPFIGVLLDRWNRKLTMIIADSSIALFSLALGLYYYFGEPSLAFVYLILMVRSTASAFHAPAFQAAIPLIAPEDQLTRVAGWQQMIFSFSTVIGPALGIAVYSATSLGVVLLLDVAGALIANLMLLFVKFNQPKPEVKQQPHFFNELKLGWQTFIQVKPVVTITLAAAIFSVAFMPLAMLFPFMTLSHFERGGYSASLVEAVFSIGMMAGGLLLSVAASRWKDVTYIGFSLVAIGATCVASGLIGKDAFIAFVVLSFLMGATAPFFNGPYMAMIQRAYEPEMLGRVISIATSVMLLASPVGLLMAGPLVDKYGVQMWFFWSGIVVVLTGLFIFVQFKRLQLPETVTE